MPKLRKYNVEITIFRNVKVNAKKVIEAIGKPDFFGEKEMYDNYGRYDVVIYYKGVNVYEARKIREIAENILSGEGIVFTRKG
jgi:hypothetical protein